MDDLLELASRLRKIADEAEYLARSVPAMERARKARASRHPDLFVSSEAVRCEWKGRLVTGLSFTHIVIVEYLSRYPDFVRSREQILSVIDPDELSDDRSIDSHIRRIRGRFAAVDPSFDQIETVHGLGYKWRKE